MEYDCGHEEPGVWAEIKDLLIDYQMAEKYKEMYAKITGSYPYPAHKDPLVELAQRIVEGRDTYGSVRADFLESVEFETMLAIGTSEVVLRSSTEVYRLRIYRAETMKHTAHLHLVDNLALVDNLQQVHQDLVSTMVVTIEVYNFGGCNLARGGLPKLTSPLC